MWGLFNAQKSLIELLKDAQLCFHGTFHSCPMCGNVEGGDIPGELHLSLSLWGLIQTTTRNEGKDTYEGCRRVGSVTRSKMVLQLLIVSPKVDLPSSLPLILCRACLVALRWAVLYMYLHSWPHIVTLMVWHWKWNNITEYLFNDNESTVPLGHEAGIDVTFTTCTYTYLEEPVCMIVWI